MSRKTVDALKEIARLPVHPADDARNRAAIDKAISIAVETLAKLNDGQMSPREREYLTIARAMAIELRGVLEAQEEREEHIDIETGEVYQSHVESKRCLESAERRLWPQMAVRP